MRVGANVPHADVVTPDDDNVGFHVKPHEFDPTVQRLAFRRVVAGDGCLRPIPRFLAARRRCRDQPGPA